MERKRLIILIACDKELIALVASCADVLDAAVLHVASLADAVDRCDTSVAACAVVEIKEAPSVQLEESLLNAPFARPFVVVSMDNSFTTAVDAMRKGALDCMARPIDSVRLLNRLREGLELDADRRAQQLQQAATMARVATLTPRERQVLNLVASGRLTKEIAVILEISPKTVEVHRSNITRKMQVDSAAELLFVMAAAGLPLRVSA